MIDTAKWPTHGLKAIDGSDLPCARLAVAMLEAITNSKTAYSKMFHTNYYPYSDQNAPGDLQIEVIRERLQRIIMETIFAYARKFDVHFVSFGVTELIADCGSSKKDNVPFSRAFAWEVLEALGMRGSCGNGITNEIYQYQYNWHLFNPNLFGIYNPKTGKQFYEVPFNLYTRSRILTSAFDAIKNDPDNATAVIDRLYQENRAEWGERRMR